MKRSKKPTNTIAIQAFTGSEWDSVDFALLTLTPELLDFIKSKDEIAKSLSSSDPSFYCIQFWERPNGWYVDTDENFFFEGDEWYYVKLDGKEEFLSPEQAIDATTIVFAGGYFKFKGYGKHTSEEFWTGTVDVEMLLANNIVNTKTESI